MARRTISTFSSDIARPVSRGETEPGKAQAEAKHRQDRAALRDCRMLPIRRVLLHSEQASMRLPVVMANAVGEELAWAVPVFATIAPQALATCVPGCSG